MRFNLLASIVFALSIPACGGGDDGGDDTSGDDTADDTGDDSGDDTSGQPDAPPTADAVEEVACAGGEMEVTTPGFNFDPASVTITAGQSVHFILGGSHNVASTTSGVEFELGFGADACLRFNEARTYTFECEPHGFTGEVVVE
jgi:plastocyanin